METLTLPPRPLAAPAVTQQRSPFLLRLFRRYLGRYLRRHFHAVRLTHANRPPSGADGPQLIVLNHPSWWDPLIACVLTDLFPRHRHFAPIDAAALGMYRFFNRLGLFGIETGTVSGARAFLRTSLALLAEPDAAVWITAQGRFTDPRQRPPRLKPGIAALARRLSGGTLWPLALEYPFWDERLPEALAHFGRPLALAGGRGWNNRDWLGAVEERLQEAQDQLAAAALRRDPAMFDVLLEGKSGVSAPYDLWRRARSWWRGETFHSAHGEST